MPDRFDELSAAIGELKADTKRHNETLITLAADIKQVANAFSKLIELQTELAQYRHLNHERFNRLTVFENEMEEGLEQAQNARHELGRRITALEDWRSLQIKVTTGILGGLAAIIGWFSGVINELIKRMFQ